jgi:hypothetical protein
MMSLEEMRGKPGWVAVKLDWRNAHNENSRAAVVEVLQSEASLQHLALHAATCLAGHQGLEAKGKLWGRTGEGETQGDPDAGPWFCVAIHPHVGVLAAGLRAAGGGALFGNDDGYLWGPAAEVFPSLDQLVWQVGEKCLLQLQVSKTEVFSWEESLPAETPRGMKRAGTVVEGRFAPGFMCYGIAVGSTEFVRAKLEEKVDEVAAEVEKVVKVLAPKKDYQAMWSILQCSLSQKLDWQLSLNYPSDVAAAASRLDRIFWQVLELCLAQHIPLAEEGGQVECVLTAPGLPPSLQGRSFQHWLVRQPVRLRGLGLRSLLETSPAAFCGGVEMALPLLTGDLGVCPSLEEVVGRVEGPAKWTEFLRAGSRTAGEFEAAWGKLRLEGLQMADMLDKELPESWRGLPGEEEQGG